MSYASIQYVLFILVLSIIYYLLPTRFRWWVLLVGSIGFYLAAAGWVIVFPAFSALTAWLLAGRFSGMQTRLDKLILSIAIIINVGILFVCKWGCWTLGLFMQGDLISIVVPVGISFYTLSLIGYCVDTYRDVNIRESNFGRFLLFTVFFPYILQGPIVRYSTVNESLFAGNNLNYKDYTHGWQLVLWGLIEKLVIADWLGVIVDTVFESGGDLTGFYIVLGFVMYSFQLYADFSGCVDIAIGTAGIFGITLPQNFRQPYFASSVREFWQRWHISLSSWLRDYIYIPLGGNRKGKFRKIINTMVVFLVSGIWHGVGLKFILWGGLHGVCVNAGSIFKVSHGNGRGPATGEQNGDKAGKKAVGKTGDEAGNSSKLRNFVKVLKILVTFVVVTFLWGIFRADSVSHFIRMLRYMIRDNNMLEIMTDPGQFVRAGVRMVTWAVTMMFLLLKFLVDVMHEKGIGIRDSIDKKNTFVRWLIYIAAILALLVFGRYGSGYSAADFIYGQF